MTATLDDVIVPILEIEETIKDKNDDLVYPYNAEIPFDSFHDGNMAYYEVNKRCIPYNFSHKYLNISSFSGKEFTYIEQISNYNIVPSDRYITEYSYHNETHSTYNNNSAVIYELNRDYAYVECKCLTNLYPNYNKLHSKDPTKFNEFQSENKKFEEIYGQLICYINEQIREESEKNAPANKREKWIIFLSNKKHGELLNKSIDNNNSVFITAESKYHDQQEDKEVYENIIQHEKFHKKVLITTSVLDNGINIIDPTVKHIVISFIDKVSFLQCLGRVRTTEFSSLTLYLRKFSINDLNGKRRSILDSLRRISNYKHHKSQATTMIVNEIFSKDDLFYNSTPVKISYNTFAEKKLILELKFLNDLIQKIKSKNSSLMEDERLSKDSDDDFISFSLSGLHSYDEYLKNHKIAYYSNRLREINHDDAISLDFEKIFKNIQSNLSEYYGENSSYIEQLRWLGKSIKMDDPIFNKCLV